jgi:hypothetical protein
MSLLSIALFALCSTLDASAVRIAASERSVAARTAQVENTEPERAFLELATARERYFVGESIHVRIRFGIERDFARTSLVQLFRQALDVPVQIEAPWIDGLANAPALTTVPQTTSLARKATFALGERPAEARRLEDRIADGHAFTVLEYETTLVARTQGELTIPSTELHYAYATRFDEDFVQGRVALDRLDASVRGAPLVLTILALPEKDRPADFGGAVGTFTITAELPAHEVVVGESLALVVHIDGDGNFASFDAPRVDRLGGFHVRGVLEDRSASRLTVTYDLAPDDERDDSVPPIRFSYFDPTPPARYRTIETASAPIRVRAAPSPAVLPTEASAAAQGSVGPARIENSGPAPAPSAGFAARGNVLLLVGVLLLTLALCTWLVVRVLVRRRTDAAASQSRAGNDVAPRIHALLAAPEKSAEHDHQKDADLSGALAEYLASRLGCQVAAVMAPDLAARLRNARVPDELATRTAKLLEALVSARYGGPHRAPDVAEVRRLVADLERSL